jgi:hypothetical protein
VGSETYYSLKDKYMSDKNIKKGPASRDNICYIIARDIIVPAGTVMRQADQARGGKGFVECGVGHGQGCMSYIVIEMNSKAEESGLFIKKIVA